LIREVAENEFELFYPLLAEIEIGSQYDSKNQEHMRWLIEKVHMRYAMGTIFFAIYTDTNIPVGIAGVLTEKPLEGVSYLGKKSELLDIAIFSEFRDQGYGSKLIQFAEDYAKLMGAYCMYVATYAPDYATVAFYGKNGFVPVATLPGVNGANEDGALYIRKIL
jgi:GNAT superfamily N-acetyltransferase